ncbi:MAG: hypothetical protein JNJ88_00810 [Planctomycetes bacterium]|nr:hypothetical protein [Planctomycetota bacterium]
MDYHPDDMDLDHQKRLYNACDPTEWLAPDDRRNLDVDSLGPEESPVRGLRWAEELCRTIQLSKDPVLRLFTGLTGCGKSTEFRRVKRILESPEGGRFLPVLIDAQDVLDLTSPIDITDILTVVVAEVERAVVAHDHGDPLPDDGFLGRIRNFLKSQSISPENLQLGAGGVSFTMELKTQPGLRQRVRRVLSSSFSAFLNEVRDALINILARAEKSDRKGIVVIFDSLEKLRGNSTNYSEVLTSAERVFSSGAPYLKLPIHTIYTVPPALFSRGVKDVSFMPMIKLTHRDGTRFEPGFDACRQLAMRRLTEADLAEVLGAETWRARLDALIESTAGYPRDLVRALQQAVANRQHPLREFEFTRLKTGFLNEYRRVVPADAFEWLAKVHLKKYVSTETASPADRTIADIMLSVNAVLAYRNDEDWFDLHPAVREIPEAKEAILRLESKLE